MSDRLRVIQDEVSAGDDVLVTTYGRPRRARVLEVHRAVLKVIYETGSQLPAYVSRKQATRVETVEAAITASRPLPLRASTAGRRPPSPEIVDAVVDVEAAATPPAPPAQQATSASTTTTASSSTTDNADEIDTWLDMGRDIVGKLEAEIAALSAAEHDMRAAAKELVAEADAAGERARTLVGRLDALRTLVK
jgi:hypothetical protein